MNKKIFIFVFTVIFLFGLFFLFNTDKDDIIDRSDHSDGLVSIPDQVDKKVQDAFDIVSSEFGNDQSAYVISDFGITFGSSIDDLLEMNSNLKVSPRITSQVYSKQKETLTLYYFNSDGGVKFKKGSDVPMYGERHKNLPPTDYVPSLPGEMIKGCMDYANSQGNYLLYKCNNIVTFDERSPWSCIFIDPENIKNEQDLWMIGTHDDGYSRSCVYDTSLRKVTRWDVYAPVIDYN